jgi:hypothetical protein
MARQKPMALLSLSVTPLASGVPSLTPIKSQVPTAKPKTSTPVKTKPVKTSTPVRTRTPTSTSTITPTGLTNTPTETATETTTPTITITATTTETPAVSLTPTITPVRDCAVTDPGLGLPVSDDTWIESATPTVNHGTDTLLSIRADNGADQRILLKFNLSSLTGTGLSVATAKLYFYIKSTSGATIFLYKSNTNWKGTDATWQVARYPVNWATPGGDYNPAPIISTTTMAGCRVQLDVTTLVQAWFTDPTTNNGVILIASGPSGEIGIPSSRDVKGPVLLVTMNNP